MPAAVRFDNVTKYYGKVRGIADLSLEVFGGEVYGYLGPNGAGKSTTIRLALDLLRPSSGTVRVLGEHPSATAVRGRIGYLPGELALYEQLTAAELLEHLDQLRGGGHMERAVRLAERLDLDTSRPIGELSRGNKQKVGLVQAFMHAPELLVLDEPTSGLDPLVQQEVYRMVEEAKTGGAAVFFSSHILSEVERIADRIGIIRDGRLVEEAQLGDLKSRAIRRFEVLFETAVPADDFRRLEEVEALQIHGRSMMCTVVGPIDPFIKALARHSIVNIVSHEADLESLFLTYYAGDDERHHDQRP